MGNWVLEFWIRPIDRKKKHDGGWCVNQLVPRLANLDPPPRSVENRIYLRSGVVVDVAFSVDADTQFDAVRRQAEIMEKLRAALIDLSVSIGFDNPENRF